MLSIIKFLVGASLLVGVLSVLWLYFTATGLTIWGVYKLVRSGFKAIGRFFGLMTAALVITSCLPVARASADTDTGTSYVETTCSTRTQYGYPTDKDDKGYFARMWDITLCTDMEWSSTKAKLIHSSITANTRGPFGLTWNVSDCQTWDKTLQNDHVVLVRGRCIMTYHALGMGFWNIKSRPIWVSMQFAKTLDSAYPQGRYIDFMDSSKVDFFGDGSESELPAPIEIPQEDFADHEATLLDQAESWARRTFKMTIN